MDRVRLILRAIPASLVAAVLPVVVGAAAVVYGVWLVWEPLGWIVGGSALATSGLMVEIGDRR